MPSHGRPCSGLDDGAGHRDQRKYVGDSGWEKPVSSVEDKSRPLGQSVPGDGGSALREQRPTDHMKVIPAGFPPPEGRATGMPSTLSGPSRVLLPKGQGLARFQRREMSRVRWPRTACLQAAQPLALPPGLLPHPKHGNPETHSRVIC